MLKYGESKDIGVSTGYLNLWQRLINGKNSKYIIVGLSGIRKVIQNRNAYKRDPQYKRYNTNLDRQRRARKLIKNATKGINSILSPFQSLLSTGLTIYINYFTPPSITSLILRYKMYEVLLNLMSFSFQTTIICFTIPSHRLSQ